MDYKKNKKVYLRNVLKVSIIDKTFKARKIIKNIKLNKFVSLYNFFKKMGGILITKFSNNCKF